MRSRAGTAHHWSGRSTTGASGRPMHPGQAQQERRDPGGALHPGRARRQQRRVLPVLDEPPAGPGVVADRPLDEGVTHRAGSREQRVARAGSVASWAASSSTSPTPAVPQQRPSLSQKPGRSRCGTPEVRTECRQRCRSSPTSKPPTSVDAGVGQRREQLEVPAGPWHQV